MNKRDTIMVVFRVIAIFLFFSLLSSLTRLVNDLTYFNVVDPISPSPAFKLIRILIMTALPFAFSFMVWNKSGWIADKILAPFGMDELWEDSTETTSSSEEEPSINQETTITHLNRDEIELIVLTAIGVWILASSVPELIRFLFSVFSHEHMLVEEIISLGIEPTMKCIIGGWLLARSNNLMVWLSRWREHRMQD